MSELPEGCCFTCAKLGGDCPSILPCVAGLDSQGECAVAGKCLDGDDCPDYVEAKKEES